MLNLPCLGMKHLGKGIYIDGESLWQSQNVFSCAYMEETCLTPKLLWSGPPLLPEVL